jgi:hypothetical protein
LVSVDINETQPHADHLIVSGMGLLEFLRLNIPPPCFCRFKEGL